MQDILDTGKFNWPGQGECEAELWAGGDSPWSRRWMGVSTASQVGSIHNEAVLRGTGKNRHWGGLNGRPWGWTPRPTPARQEEWDSWKLDYRDGEVDDGSWDLIAK